MPAQTLLVNPPLVDGVAFTRQGRCQEREEVLGTTKPPYTLVIAAALLRERGVPLRLVDLTAEQRDTASLAAELHRSGFTPDLIVFPATTPTLRADCAAMADLRRTFPGARLVCFGPHAATAPRESMERAPEVDAMIVGEPEEAIVALATMPPPADFGAIPSITWRRDGAIVPHTTRGVFGRLLHMPFPAWDLLDLRRYRLPMVDSPYVIVETSRGCPYSCDFCMAPILQGHQFRERPADKLVDEIERAHRELGVRYFYLWGDTVTLNRRSFSRFCDELIARRLRIRWFGNARADSLTDPDFVGRLRRSGCWMLGLGIESASPDVRRAMAKRLEEEEIRGAMRNLRTAGIKSFAFFILGYPGDTVDSMNATIDYAIELDADFVNFYPAVPYPGTDLHAKCARRGQLASEDWSKMEYSYYVLNGDGLDERVVMSAIARARRRFYLRPTYVWNHLADGIRLLRTNPILVASMMRSLLAKGRGGRIGI